ncbi:molybdopterin molybdotransferase MoeA [Methanocaldococcus indicus]|uniref:molybdopterin molybdotransferase MoeA n=1 Tax=Methanocaldococcus indicus TaxID=213231 RepID=UPI003C6D621E
MLFKEVLDFNKAREIVYSYLNKYVKSSNIKLIDGLNKIAYEDVKAPINLPYFNRSAMDGYAVRAEDVSGASQTNPIILNLVERDYIDEGEAKKVHTGDKLPEGANAVVMKEYCNEYNNFLEVYKSVHPNENVSKIGEDVKKGDTILKKGEKISPYHLAILSSLGIKNIKVYDLKIGVISTGAELVSLEEGIKNNKIINSNYYLLYGLLKNLGFDVVDYGIVKDNLDNIKETLKKANEEVDIIFTTGGTSVGDRDLTVKAVKELGDVILHGVNIRPGKPFAFGVIDKPIFMLSGYPVAAAVQFELFFYRYFAQRKKIMLELSHPIPSQLGRVDFVRVKIVKNKVLPVRITGSGVISSLIKSDGYIIVDENIEGYEKGEKVEVYLF